MLQQNKNVLNNTRESLKKPPKIHSAPFLLQTLYKVQKVLSICSVEINYCLMLIIVIFNEGEYEHIVSIRNAINTQISTAVVENIQCPPKKGKNEMHCQPSCMELYNSNRAKGVLG